jgi:hypothetical protein
LVSCIFFAQSHHAETGRPYFSTGLPASSQSARCGPCDNVRPNTEPQSTGDESSAVDCRDNFILTSLLLRPLGNGLLIWTPADTLSKGEVNLWCVPQLWSAHRRVRRQKVINRRYGQNDKIYKFDPRTQPGSHIFAYIRQCTLRFMAISDVSFWATAAGPAGALGRAFC